MTLPDCALSTCAVQLTRRFKSIQRVFEWLFGTEQCEQAGVNEIAYGQDVAKDHAAQQDSLHIRNCRRSFVHRFQLIGVDVCPCYDQDYDRLEDAVSGPCQTQSSPPLLVFQ